MAKVIGPFTADELNAISHCTLLKVYGSLTPSMETNAVVKLYHSATAAGKLLYQRAGNMEGGEGGVLPFEFAFGDGITVGRTGISLSITNVAQVFLLIN